MAETSTIEWTDATWNPITGCTVHSAGCTNCYAMQLAGTRLKSHPSRAGLTREVNGRHVWTGEVRFNEQWLTQPLHWQRSREIFVCAHADLFHEGVPDEWIDRVFAVMSLSPQHRFQVLTKRAERMRAYLTDPDAIKRVDREQGRIYSANAKRLQRSIHHQKRPHPNWPLPWVWLGVSVEDQRAADERIPHLLETPAAVRWLSCEPLLGAVDLRWIAQPDEERDGVIDALLGCDWIEVPGDDFHPQRPGHEDRRMGRWVVSGDADILANRKLDWVVVGGEHGPRPMHAAWARGLRDQCATAGVPFFFKQWGNSLPAGQMQADGKLWNPSCGSTLLTTKAYAGRFLDGVTHDAMPA